MALTLCNAMPSDVSPRPWVVALVAVFVGLASVGAASESPSRRLTAGSCVAANQAAQCSVELRAATHPQAANVGSRDLRLPRAPRHRSDRPTSSLTEIEALTAITVLVIIDDEGRHSMLIECPSAWPLAGHPLSLLRPPSLLAG